MSCALHVAVFPAELNPSFSTFIEDQLHSRLVLGKQKLKRHFHTLYENVSNTLKTETIPNVYKASYIYIEYRREVKINELHITTT